jgi:rod shape-determining protein MreC
MDSIRSWWERYSFQTAIVTVGIGLAWVIRQTQGKSYCKMPRYES